MMLILGYKFIGKHYTWLVDDEFSDDEGVYPIFSPIEDEE